MNHSLKTFNKYSLFRNLVCLGCLLHNVFYWFGLTTYNILTLIIPCLMLVWSFYDLYLLKKYHSKKVLMQGGSEEDSFKK